MSVPEGGTLAINPAGLSDVDSRYALVTGRSRGIALKLAGQCMASPSPHVAAGAGLYKGDVGDAASATIAGLLGDNAIRKHDPRQSSWYTQPVCCSGATGNSGKPTLHTRDDVRSCLARAAVDEHGLTWMARAGSAGSRQLLAG
jgi:hypothetical protein